MKTGAAPTGRSLDIATMPGKPTRLARVTPRIRSRFGEVPGTVPLASVVICASKNALAPVTAPPSATMFSRSC